MEVVSFAELGKDAWNMAVYSSDDAWFWHTRLYTDFLLELNQGQNVQDLSFAFVDGSRVLAACPLYLENSTNVKQFGCGGEPIPFPALSRILSSTARQRVLGLYFKELQSFAAVHGAKVIKIRISPLAHNHIVYGLNPFNLLAKSGFLDLPVATQIINLQLDEADLWGSVRKGHRYDIRHSDKQCKIIFWDQTTITTEAFGRYQELHRKDAGRVTRSQKSFEIMNEWIKAGYALLVEAKRGECPIGFILVTLFADGAFYGSGCKDPDQLDLNVSHALQWRVILWLKANGYNYYDMGLQHFGPQWFNAPTVKELSISKFKRGFGGTTVPVHTGEFFYDPNTAKDVFSKRMELLSQDFASEKSY